MPSLPMRDNAFPLPERLVTKKPEKDIQKLPGADRLPLDNQVKPEQNIARAEKQKTESFNKAVSSSPRFKELQSGVSDMGTVRNPESNLKPVQNNVQDRNLSEAGFDFLMSYEPITRKNREKPKRSGYDYDYETGMMVDRRELAPEYETREEATARREASGEKMFHPDEGQYVDIEDGRVRSGEYFNENGDVDFLNPAVEGGGPIGGAVNFLSDAAAGVYNYVTGIRRNNAIANADMRFRTPDGKNIDLDDILDADEFQTYVDNAKSGIGKRFYYNSPDGRVDTGYKVSDDDINEDGTVDIVKILNKVYPEWYMDENDVVHINDSIAIPMDQMEQSFGWGYDDLVLPSGESLTFDDVINLLDNKGIYNANQNPFDRLNPQMFDNEGNFDVSSLPAMIMDGLLSTIPFMIPIEREFMTASPFYTWYTGLDPFSFDPETWSYEDPGSLSEDERLGRSLSVGGETALERASGVAKANVIGPFFRSFFPKQAAKHVEKELKRGLGSRIWGDIVGEGAEEGISALLEPLSRGNYPATYFANPLYDQNNNIVRDAEGKIVWDENTPIVDRVKTAAGNVAQNAALGGAIGGMIGGVGAPMARKRDEQKLIDMYGYVPGKNDSVRGYAKISEEEAQLLDDYFSDYLERRDNA